MQENPPTIPCSVYHACPSKAHQFIVRLTVIITPIAKHGYLLHPLTEESNDFLCLCFNSISDMTILWY